jgi:alkylation response protein AidB-like acyl-CoA dehydrogenase
MSDFALTEDQVAFRDLARKFARNEVATVAAQADRIADPAEAWNAVAGVVQKGLQLGFGKLGIPEQYGGLGAGLTEMFILAEELAVADSGIAMCMINTATLPMMIALGGTEAQKEKWLRPTAEDETGTYSWAAAASEPTGGNEIVCPVPEPRLGVHTHAVRDGEGYRITGHKAWTSNAGAAQVYFVLARTRMDKANLEACNFFIFDRNTPGFTVGKPENKLGNRTLRQAEIYFENLRVPAEDMLGEEGAGFHALEAVHRGNAVVLAGICIGIAKAAYNTALAYTQQRIIWGQATIKHQAVASRLVKMRTSIEASRALVQKLIWALEHPQGSDGMDKLTRIAKVYASEMVAQVASDAMYLLGGYGYTKDYPVEKLVRDSLVFRFLEGANEVHELFTASELQPI